MQIKGSHMMVLNIRCYAVYFEDGNVNFYMTMKPFMQIQEHLKLRSLVITVWR